MKKDSLKRILNYKNFPCVKILITFNIVYFVAILFAGGPTIHNLIQFGGKVNFLIADGQYWRFLTSMFMHADIWHITFNMVALFYIGRDIERLYGPVKFLIIYFSAGFIGGGLSYLLNDAIGVGASGAIFGLLGANVYLYFLNKEAYKKVYGFNMFFLLGINLVYGLMQPNIDNFAHLGGFLGGLLAAFAIGIRSENIKNVKRYMLQALLILCILLPTIGGTIYYKSTPNHYINLSIYEIQNREFIKANETIDEGLYLFPDNTNLNQINDFLTTNK